MPRGILWFHLKKSGFLLFLSFFMVFVSGCASLALGKVIGHSVQLFAGEQVRHTLSLGVVLFAVFLSLTVALRSIFSGLLGMKVVQGMLLDLYEALLRAKIETIKCNSAQIPIILSSDMTFLQNFFGSAAPVLLRNLITFLGSLIALFYTERQLFIYLILAIPVLLVPLLLVGARARKLSSLFAGKTDNFHAELRENIGNIQMIKSFLKETFFLERLQDLSKGCSSSFVQYVIIRSVLIGIVVATAFLGTVFFMDFGLRSVYAGEINIATLAEFVFYALFGSSSIGRVMELYPDLRQFLNIRTRVENLYSTILASSEEEVGKKLKRFEKLEFKDVGFSYTVDGSDAVFKGLNFTVNRGEKVAFVGASGKGKSTIFSLILRFYTTFSGSIRINDIPVSELSLASIRSLFAWVPQELSIVSGSLMENICMQASIEQKEESRYKSVCMAANIHQLPKDTHITDLSRGQRQRINIARALFADRQVILLDEATSSLDTQNEKAIEAVISNTSRDKTVVIIAHRFSSIKCADKIIVIENGKATAVGTHDELLASSPFYKQMAEE
ncbi:ABC transporter ATP-binding protein [Neorickettsia risticii]|uniref:ABC transporter, ATP-binding/permease protein n=1 Tax=Neorickettsia risticii (strain Illinois) TaxID=434131 RepID=C6V4Q7_NEORI|nr:ABC transporter ATP-binding protein [Neorickettsia risticii]ACT69377.1 putative ABC transporter, ATP-binding/permease protein [Neorickettsia risticii str. Illinois]